LHKLRLGNVAQDGSIHREAAVAATEAGDMVEVGVVGGWADLRQDLEDPVCAHAAGIAHLM